MINLNQAARMKYEEFLDEGSLIIMNTPTLEMLDVFDDLYNHISDRSYDVRTFGYDPYNAEAFVKQWCINYGSYGVMMVRQGKRTESVPLGELKQLAEDRLLLFDEALMSFAMGNAIVQKDINNNKMLAKRRNEDKIDPVAAMLDAYVAMKATPDAFD